MIALEHVTRDFESPSGATYTAIDDVSVTIGAGTFSAIVGPSGCGKSTLLNIVAGLLPASRGTVRVAGEPLQGVNRRATYMFQQDALLPWKDVRENVALGLTLAGTARREATARADAWLARVGLAPFARHFPAQLSGGMRKRVAMAQNWIIDRDIVLMDEPFSALDIHTRQRMETELLSLWETSRVAPRDRVPSRDDATSRDDAASRNDAAAYRDVASGFSRTNRKTIVFVTHDLEEALALADEVLVLSAGPASRIVSRHAVPLDRPRDLLELRTTSAFVDLYRAVWADLREEVIKSQREKPRA